MSWLPLTLGIFTGAGLGVVIGYLIAERRLRLRQGDTHTQQAVAEHRCEDLTNQLAAEQARGETFRSHASIAEKNAATLAAQLEAAQRGLLEQRKLLDQAQVQLREAFASVSAEALAKNNEAFLQLARERFATITTEAAGSLQQRQDQIDGMLKPMREVLHQYQTRLTEIEKSRLESYSMLREQLGTLAETQRTLNTQTSQLVTALSRPTTRGQWGEISLRRLVELAGMTNRCDFVEQSSVDGEDGRLRPDMIVNLPGGRDVVIDCKASLDGFLDAAAAVDQDARRVCLMRHSQQVRSRARDLAGKSYWSQFSRSPEYVVMFLPGEAFLYAAVEHDGALIEDCLRSRVIVATPTTLIALLKAIEFGWRQEAITENVEQIRTLGKELYDRVAKLADHFAKLGSSLDTAVGSYNQAIGSLQSRVLVTARKIGELGAGTDKEIPDLSPVDSRTRELSISG